MRILLIDDSPEFLGFMEALLTSEGFAVSVAQTAGAVRARLADGRPDLIISDVRMPEMPAFGVLNLVEMDERTRDVPILFCTGAVQEVEEAGERLKQRGAQVLFKPFDIDDLLARIAALQSPHEQR
jgi:DNA-binding response OmpR family regulator